jgi:dTDP-4-amino-4,6-dideoxygalactose transaminase
LDTSKFQINHNYLLDQFKDYQEILVKISEIVKRGDFTLGQEVDEFESEFAARVGTKYAIGVGSGTDALFLSLRALDIGPGDEVITTPFTFYATVGAIVTAGAKPVFVDIGDDHNLDERQVSAKITKATKAIMPIHWSGNPCNMLELEKIAKEYNLKIISDACHSVDAELQGKKIGAFGEASCFSLHPLKNLNVWGDGGLVATDSDDLNSKLRLLRNHGLVGRDECAIFGYNSRLDTIQAVVARHLLKKLDKITETRISNASYFDQQLKSVNQIRIPSRDPQKKSVYHLYSFTCDKRDQLKAYLNHNGVDAKIHYPVPIHLQPAARYLKYLPGDFPMSEKIAGSTLSLPVHEFVNAEQREKVVNLIREFYGHS